MNAVILIELRLPGNTVEEKRQQGHSHSFCNGLVGITEASCIARTEIGRRFHYGEQDPRLRLLTADDVYDPGKIRLKRQSVERAQCIVAAGLEYDNVHRPLEHPVDPPQRPRRRLT